MKSWLNTEAPLVGRDETPDLSPGAFRVENGTFSTLKSDTFGYGGVLNWPHQYLELPWRAKVALHYNTSENFVPASTASINTGGRSRRRGARARITVSRSTSGKTRWWLA